MKKSKILFDWLPALFLILLSWVIQSHLFLEKDVIYLSNAANLLLHGGNYIHDFFETNPPMILFLYWPAILIHKLTALNMIISIRVYLFYLAIISMALCYTFILTIFKNTAYVRALVTVIAFILFILPASQLAQREHLLTILTLPYLFVAILRLQNKPIHISLAIIVGLMAGLGFAIKPYFLTTPFLIESYFIWSRRHIFGWVRTESLLIIAVLLLYFIIIHLFFSDYLHILLPFIIHHYVSYIHYDWLTLLTLPTVDFCFLIGIISFFIPKNTRDAIASNVFLLALIGFTLSFMITRTPWYFHVLPALSMACLLGILLILPYFELIAHKALAFMALLLLFAIPLYFSGAITLLAINEKKSGDMNKLIEFFQQQAPHTFTAYTLSSRFLWLVNYSPAIYVGRFSLFWWQPSLLCQSNVSRQQMTDKQWMINLLSEDLLTKKPDYVLVDTIPSSYCLNKNIQYIKEFSLDRHFQEDWKNYHFIKQLAGYDIYRREAIQG